MLTRLVLVGMVAALGITVPTWPETRGWMSALHSWTACRLEEWDASGSSDSDSVAPPPLVHRPRPVFTPIEPDETASAVADALNRVSDGQDLRPEQALATRRPTGRETDHPGAGCERIESSGVPSLDSREGEWMAELRQAFERSEAQVGADEVPAAPRRSRMRLDPPLVCVFTASSVIAAPVRPVTAAPVETSPRPRRSGPKFDPAQALAAVESEISGGWYRFAGRIARWLPGRATANRPQSPAFEPIDPALAVSTSLADELNRTSEGIAIARPGIEDSRSPASVSEKSSVRSTAVEGRRPSSAGPSPEVARAMRLTRDAVHAWVKVMAGPASIQVSAR